MRNIIQQADCRQMSKSLLQFGGVSQLEGHLRVLKNAAVGEFVLEPLSQ
jgi:hypothetical protein